MPDQSTTTRDAKLAKLAAVNQMTDHLAHALEAQVSSALSAGVDPQEILDELDEAWGSGAHDHASRYLVDDLGWRYEDNEWFNAAAIRAARAARKAA